MMASLLASVVSSDQGLGSAIEPLWATIAAFSTGPLFREILILGVVYLLALTLYLLTMRTLRSITQRIKRSRLYSKMIATLAQEP